MTSDYAQMIALRDHLRTITVANGYPITVDAVEIGNAALVGDGNTTKTVIALVMQQDAPDTNTAPQSGFQRWERTLALEASAYGASNWDETVSALWYAIRRALHRFTQFPMSWQPAEFVAPAMGSTGSGVLCGVRVSLSFIYQLDFRGK